MKYKKNCIFISIVALLPLFFEKIADASAVKVITKTF